MREAERLQHRPVDGDDVAGGHREGEADLPLQGQHVLGLHGGGFLRRHAASIEPAVVQRLGHQSSPGRRRPVRSARGAAVAGRRPAADVAGLADRLRAAAAEPRRAAAARRRHQSRGVRRPGDALGVAGTQPPDERPRPAGEPVPEPAVAHGRAPGGPRLGPPRTLGRRRPRQPRGAHRRRLGRRPFRGARPRRRRPGGDVRPPHRRADASPGRRPAGDRRAAGPRPQPAFERRYRGGPPPRPDQRPRWR